MPDELELANKKVSILEQRIYKYEENGAAKLFYALNRKMNEMADRLNATDLKTISLDDHQDKTFDRLKVIWNDAASIAVAVKTIGETAGVTGDEKSDTTKKIYQRTTPESIADELGENKKQDV